MTIAVVAFISGAAFTLVALVAYSKLMDEHPPLASRWVIRGREVEVYAIYHNDVFVYVDNTPAHYPLKYFMAAAKPVAEVKP